MVASHGIESKERLARLTAFRYSLTMSESAHYPVFKGPATL
jgi:hypothetical protein